MVGLLAWRMTGSESSPIEKRRKTGTGKYEKRGKTKHKTKNRRNEIKRGDLIKKKKKQK